MARTRTVGSGGLTGLPGAPTGMPGVAARPPGALAMALAALLAFVGACRDEPPLTGARSLLRVSQESVAFPASYPGVERVVELRVVNAGRTTLDVDWTSLAPPFSADGLPARMAPGEVPVRLSYRPEATGVLTATLVGLPLIHI
ncbi:hypothetical protein D7W79_42610, partial [Corallococcus exercitus]